MTTKMLVSISSRVLILMSLLQVFSFATLVPSTNEGGNYYVTNDTNGCLATIHRFDPYRHKQVYRVGVYASEGEQVVFDMYGNVFANYLTATAGKRFTPPLRFEVVPVSLTQLMDLADEEQVDFLFTSSAVFSCMATERKAQALATIINRRASRGYEYDLDKYGGVMFTLNDKDNGIDNIQDFKGRTIGAGAITAMGAGQTQFYEMVNAGLSYVADPKQVIFTYDERQVVQGVLDGEFEIGFARTDQIERHTDAEGNPLKEDTFKVINPQTHVMDDGTLFPFVSSTGLHPEWPVGALDHVDRTVSQEVQDALLAIQSHSLAFGDISKKLRCDTTPEMAQLALDSMMDGAFTGFRTPRSYFLVRTKQEKAGIVREDPESGQLHCIRGDTLYFDLECPVGQYKVTEEEFAKSCEVAGLPCKEGYECYCQPCVKAFEVDVFQYFGRGHSNYTEVGEVQQGCEKMSVCGHTTQREYIVFRAVDNVQREGAEVTVILHNDQEEDIDLHVREIEPFVYEFEWVQNTVGVGIIEVFVDGEQIPESPMRLQVEPKTCDAETFGHGMVPTDLGVCVCDEDTADIGGTCVDNTILAVIGSIVAVIIISIIGCIYISHKQRKNDELWQVVLDELHFDDPVEVIGQGSFGVVLLAEYRGTKVAIKRAIRSKQKNNSASKSVNTKNEPNDANSEVMHSCGSLGSDSEQDLESDRGNPKPGVVDQSTTQGTNHFSIGFLEEDFGRRKKSIWPWDKKRNDYQSKFHQSILGTASTSSKQSTALEVFCCMSDRVRQRQDFKSEMRILARLRHPCITTVMGAVVTRTHEPMLVMEFMEYGSLHDILRNETMYLNGEIILQIARDLAQGLRYLHTSKPPILHGDLKARNILLDARFRAKLCDFGLSNKTDSISGTPFWLAPEYLRGEKKYDTTCDMYSVGILLHEIYSRKSPYAGEDFRDVIRGVCNRRVNKRPKIPDTTPPKMVEIMKKCYSPDPNYRPVARDLDMGFLDMIDDDAEPMTADQQYEIRNRARSADMIYELFPRHVAELIKKGQKVEPESHDLVTVIFSDIINFTDISQAISPEKVCDMLDRLYVQFDGIARKHQVFKVETIGDAYMGVTNLEKNQERTQVKQIAEFAIEMVNEARKVMIDIDDPSKGFINIRVGFHSGPVVSNVIGTLNKRFGLFGDTVNTASRMESNATANRILCSERSYKLLKEQAPHIKTKYRGLISVKGKGDMNVYWVGDNMLRSKNKGKGFQKEKAVAFAEDLSHTDHTGSDRHFAAQQAMDRSAASGSSASRARPGSPHRPLAVHHETTPRDNLEQIPVAPLETAPPRPLDLLADTADDDSQGDSHSAPDLLFDVSQEQALPTKAPLSEPLPMKAPLAEATVAPQPKKSSLQMALSPPSPSGTQTPERTPTPYRSPVPGARIATHASGPSSPPFPLS